MKITIVSTSEPRMELFLHPESGGVIQLRGRDANGSDWCIATISENGIRLKGNIDATSNWPLDEKGRLKLIL